MISEEVTTLYKYYPPTEYSLAALRDRAFWCASPKSFNDPFDCRLSLAEDALDESIKYVVARLQESPGVDPSTLPPGAEKPTPADAEAFRWFRTQLLSLFDNVGIFCLSEVPDNLLMWAHYADSHRGFCLGFRRAADNILGQAALPVTYSEDLPRLTAAHFDPLTNPHSADALWLTKSSSWSYEREWRVLASKGNERRSLDAPIISLRFGMRMATEYRRAVFDALSTYPSRVAFFQAEKSPTRFGIELRPAQDGTDGV